MRKPLHWGGLDRDRLANAVMEAEQSNLRLAIVIRPLFVGGSWAHLSSAPVRTRSAGLVKGLGMIDDVSVLAMSGMMDR